MLTDQIRNDIDKLWEKFWTGGIINPLTVIEQISYLMFSRMLDMQEDIAECKANRTGKAVDRLFPNNPKGQFRTPRHIIDAMVELIDPQPGEVICDPACGTAGFLVHTMEYLIYRCIHRNPDVYQRWYYRACLVL